MINLALNTGSNGLVAGAARDGVSKGGRRIAHIEPHGPFLNCTRRADRCPCSRGAREGVPRVVGGPSTEYRMVQGQYMMGPGQVRDRARYNGA